MKQPTFTTLSEAYNDVITYEAPGGSGKACAGDLAWKVVRLRAVSDKRLGMVWKVVEWYGELLHASVAAAAAQRTAELLHVEYSHTAVIGAVADL